MTDDGRAMLGDAGKVEEAMRRLGDNAAARGGDVAGVVRMAAPETLTTNLVLPALRPILDRYPALMLDVVTGIDTIGIARGEGVFPAPRDPPPIARSCHRSTGRCLFLWRLHQRS
ncbi:hypothetical protein ACFQ15_17350 [Sphingomonas hankookensis]|uniref:hypothetical protein n=1 Tax=Sphingomonas hankookensis TaxID=563996 RepID=UPI001F57D0E1|nr:hypothetical protein [Sphingomonas hankookensis]